MFVNVKLFATLRRYGPGNDVLGDSFPVLVDDSSTVTVLLEKLKIPKDQAKIVMINGTISKIQEKLQDKDVVAIFPPVGGGS